jgi:endonuclease/exonuclease/phosphatase family metal-dependent hydrolase
VAFNVLAPVWASPVWYPDGLDTSLLDAGFRRDRIASLIAAAAPSTDVFCLQEVQQSELPAFLAAAGSGFEGFMAFNDPAWWSNWVVPEIPWAPNGTAVIVRRAMIDVVQRRDIALTDDGNHAALLEGTLRTTGRAVRIASIHLDSDRNANRLRESRSLVAQLPGGAGALDIACGDINEDAVHGSAANVFRAAGFTAVLGALGNREPTHPFTSSYNRSPRWAIIDHILVRGGEPVAGTVVDSGVWVIEDEIERIEANLRRVGSDHFPVVATVAG